MLRERKKITLYKKNSHHKAKVFVHHLLVTAIYISPPAAPTSLALTKCRVVWVSYTKKKTYKR